MQKYQLNSIVTLRHPWLSGVTVMATALLLTACGNQSNIDQQQTQSANAKQDKAQTIKIVTESSYKPFSYTDAQGNLVGFEIDLAHALCQQMKTQCQIVSQDWDGLIPGLQAKKFDAVMAGMSVTPERSKVVAFSDPYFDNALVLLGKKGDNVGMKDLNQRTVAAQRATVSSQYLADHYPHATIKLYDTQENAYLDLKSGRVDVMLSDKVPGMDWLKTSSGADFEVKGQPIDINDHIAIALRKNDPIIQRFNSALHDIKANGTYQKIASKYFTVPSAKTGVKNVAVVESTNQDINGTKMVVNQERQADN